MSKRGQSIALGVLAVVVAGVVVASWFNYQAKIEAAQGNPGSAVTPQPNLEPKVPEPASLAPVRKALASADVVSVLGDSTGNASNEWVALWAQTMGREVRVHFLDPDTLEWLPDPHVYGSGGKPLDIWNAGVSGETADYPASRGLDELQPERPDVVVYSFGHNNDAGNIAEQMDGLTRAVEKRWHKPAEVVVLQNPGSGEHGTSQAATIEELRAWALVARLPVVNVYGAFPEQHMAPLLLDDRHPNDEGSRIWARTMAKALGY